MRPVRQAANRTRNHGITTEIMREGELSPDLRAALVAIADRHRNGEPERGSPWRSTACSPAATRSAS